MNIARWFLLACALLAPLSVSAQLFVRRSDQILKIDPTTGAQTPFFNHPTDEFIGDLVPGGNDTLLAVVSRVEFPEDDPLEPFYTWRILSINATSAEATTIYEDDLLHTDVPSIALAPSGVIYAGGADTVLEIDPVTHFAQAIYQDSSMDRIWGITIEPAGTLLLAREYFVSRLDPLTAQATNVTAFDSYITWINVFASATNGSIYLAADNEQILELNPAGDVRVVTQAGYLGSADNGLYTRDSAATGMSWLNETQLIVTVNHYTSDPALGSLLAPQSRMIWVDIGTGEQHLISEGDFLARSLEPNHSIFTGLAVLGAAQPRTAAPSLFITRDGNPESPIKLEWSAPDFVLQYSSDLNDTNAWTTLPDAPIAYSAYASFSLAPTNSAQFYRLIYTR